MTLRRSLLLAIAAFTALGLLVVTTIAVVGLRSYLISRTDDQLAAAAELARNRFSFSLTQPETVRQVVSVTEMIVEVRGAGGETIRLLSTGPLPDRPLLDQARLDDTEPQNVDDYRVVVVRDPAITVLVALSLDPVHATVRRLVLVSLITSLIFLALLTVLARWLLIRRLRPLNEIAAAATDLADGQLDRRVPSPPPGTRTEVGLLTVAVNGMLSRIQAALADRERSERRMREFVADASHELRTPVTAIRGYLQLIDSGVVDLRERPDVLRRLDQESTRMGTMVTSLLYLARLDAEPPTAREPVDLAALVRDAIADASAVDPDRPLTADAPDGCVVVAHGDSLRQVMANLLANVRSHTPPGTAATITIRPAADWVRVEVTDGGSGFDPAAAGHAFDRFWRANTARSATDGAGLGLAIVAEVIHAHGGEVGVDGSTVWFTLPSGNK